MKRSHLCFRIDLLAVLFAVFSAGMPLVQADHVHHDVSAGMLNVSQIPGWGTAYLSNTNMEDNTNCVVTLASPSTISISALQPCGLQRPGWGDGRWPVC